MEAKPATTAIEIPVSDARLKGDLTMPEKARGLVIFSHGSGSSRKSPRNRFVAEQLQERGLATLLLDLLTEREDEVYETRFDIDLLSRRLEEVAQWALKDPGTKGLPVGLFGASTGAASALRVAAELGDAIRAVVSRGGRPDLTGSRALSRVTAPTLFLVGGMDYGVIELNQAAFAELQCIKQLKIVRGATHLFEEEGKLEEVAVLAGMWLEKYLC
ncbi:MAG: alpha/beta hydrolase [Haliscomenobacteraceae bacterium CHB4]|nr:putative phosphoribosyl transferase [Saprospiraceae bacterium]MCE7925999.1 alpha/beta hydrolase [Haliscomenobacteraceae bacterium CHB4]